MASLSVRKLVVLIIVALVGLTVILSLSSSFRNFIFNRIEGLPEYKYETDEVVDISDLGEEELAMMNCNIPVAAIGGEPPGGWWEVWKNNERNLYYYDEDKEDFIETKLYWEGNTKEGLKIMFPEDWKIDDAISEEIGGEGKIRIKKDFVEEFNKHGSSLKIKLGDLYRLDGSKLIPETRFFCREKKPQLSKEAREDLENIREKVNELGESSKEKNSYVLRSDRFSLLNFGKLTLPAKKKEVCICQTGIRDAEENCRKLRGCLRTDYFLEFSSRDSGFKIIEGEKGKKICFEERENEEREAEI